MAYMLPQFKCPSEFLIRIQSHSILLKSRQPVCFQTQCVLPMTSTMTTIATVDMEKLRLPSFDSHIDPVAAGRPLMFREAISSPLKENLESAFAREMDFMHEKDIVAAAEAVALAKEAAQLAKEVALMFRDNPSDNTASDQSPSAMNELKEAQGTNIDLGGTVGLHYSDISRTNNKNSVRLLSNDSENIDTMDEELKILQMQFSESIAVRSQRSKDRRTRKPRATGKDGVQIVYAKSGPSSRKKRSSMQDIDYSDPLRHLRGTTSTSKLLTAAEESKLSEGIQDLLKLESLHESLAERCGCQPTFAQWAAAAGADTMTLRKRLNYGIFCKDKMIKCNIRLVISVAKNYQGAGMNLQDLIQEGCKGLVRGAEKFDASKGFKFSTYAHWWIKQAVRKSLSDQSRTIRLPFHMVEATYRVKEAKKRIFDEKGRYPDNKEIAEATGLTLKRIHTVLTTPKAPRSLDQPIGIDSNLKPSDIIADPESETLEEVLIKQMVKQDLYRVLGTLSPRETQVVGWRFGLEDGRTKTLQEIGEMMGVSRERVRQIESCAFRKLKNKKRTKKLQQYHLSHFQ